MKMVYVLMLILPWLREAADDEFLGMILRPVRYGSFAWLAEQLVRCGTLGEVYESMLRFYNLVAKGIHFEIRREGEQVKFMLHNAPELDGRINLLIDFLLLATSRFSLTMAFGRRSSSCSKTFVSTSNWLSVHAYSIVWATLL